MCGIVGGIGERNIVPITIEGLRRLEYRGYDSAGVAAISDFDGSIQVEKNTERVAQLEAHVNEKKISGSTSIGHTRWATHGKPSQINAHPHISTYQKSTFDTDTIAVVHNGIIENYHELKAMLQQAGYVFTSDTDTEVIPHLISFHTRSKKSFRDAFLAAVSELKGQFAIAAISSSIPYIMVARKGSPLVIGIGIGENFFASDTLALNNVTNKFVYVENSEVFKLSKTGIEAFDFDGKPRAYKVTEISSENNATSLNGFRHFMQKEIFEQPNTLLPLLDIVKANGVDEPAVFGPDAKEIFETTKNITIIACGTSYHAGLLGKQWLEDKLRIPVRVEIASEFKYKNPVPLESELIIAISQSGETADTIQAIEEYRATNSHNPKLMVICNVAQSALSRMADIKYLTNAGPEIGVASTKAFLTQIAGLYYLSLVMRQAQQQTQWTKHLLVEEFNRLNYSVLVALDAEAQIREWAESITSANNAIFLGRGQYVPIAMEGALKLKEISYIHAEAYAAGELKHGPLALIDSNMPVIFTIGNDELVSKSISNAQEVLARSGKLYILTDTAVNFTDEMQSKASFIKLPSGTLNPLSAVVVLQLLAYHSALIRGTDVDKPRNLAKSVTTE